MAREFDGNGHYRPKPTGDGTTKVSTDAAWPTDIQFMDLPVDVLPLTSSNIRDTNKKWLGTNLDWKKYRRVTLRVDNTTDQDVAIFFNLQNVGDFSNQDGTRDEYIIKAGTQRALVTPDDWPLLGVTIGENFAIGAQAATAPTTGTLSATAYLDVLR